MSDILEGAQLKRESLSYLKVQFQPHNFKSPKEEEKARYQRNQSGKTESYLTNLVSEKDICGNKSSL